MLLEKCFNFHIPIRWHLIPQLVGEGLKFVVSAVPRALTLGHSLESLGFLWRGPAGGFRERALAWGERAGDLTMNQLLPLRCNQYCVWKEREWLMMLHIKLPIVFAT